MNSFEGSSTPRVDAPSQPGKTRKLRNKGFGRRRHGGVQLRNGLGRDIQPKPHGAIAIGPLTTNAHEPGRKVNPLGATLQP
jgi:hypothetical protein